jgi:hypothetical protein
MTETSKINLKTRCFFANMCFRYVLCDSNHKKTGEKSPTIPKLLKNGLPLLGKSVDVYLNLKRRKPMKNSCDKTFIFTTSSLLAPAVQSALETVRSVECGLFA